MLEEVNDDRYSLLLLVLSSHFHVLLALLLLLLHYVRICLPLERSNQNFPLESASGNLEAPYISSRNHSTRFNALLITPF